MDFIFTISQVLITFATCAASNYLVHWLRTHGRAPEYQALHMFEWTMAQGTFLMVLLLGFAIRAFVKQFI